MKIISRLLALSLAATLCLAGAQAFQDSGNAGNQSGNAGTTKEAAVKAVKAPLTDKAIIAAQLPSYPLTKCPVSGEPITANGEPMDVVHEGRLVRLCCKGCVKGLKEDPKKAFAAIDRAVIAAQTASYPLEKCLVSDEPLDAMGKPLDHVHGTRLVRFCCKGCVKEFTKDPAKHMATIDKAMIRAQRASYPIDKCLVSNEPLDAMGEPVDQLYGTTLVRFCCKGCVKEFTKEPAKFVAQVTRAREAAAKKTER